LKTWTIFSKRSTYHEEALNIDLVLESCKLEVFERKSIKTWNFM